MSKKARHEAAPSTDGAKQEEQAPPKASGEPAPQEEAKADAPGAEQKQGEAAPEAESKPSAYSQLKRKWSLYSPGELKERCEALGSKRYLIEGLFPERSLGIIVGDSGLGKSPLLYQMALCVAAGIPFLGRAVQQGRVIYLDYENGMGQVTDIVNALARHLGLAEMPEDLLLWNYNDSPTVQLGQMVREVKPIWTIIDSLGSYQPDIDEKNSNASRAYREFRALMREAGTAITGIHHIKKPSERAGEVPAALEDSNVRRWFLQARGARALINGSDVRLGVDEPGLLSGTANNNREEIALVVRGFGRVVGEIPTTFLARVCDEDGNPLGYKQATGASLLFNDDQIAAYAKLPQMFRFKEAKQAYERRDQATTDFLQKCIALNILRKTPQGYEKL